MTFSEKIKNKIDTTKKEERLLWHKTSSHSTDYVQVLQLDKEDLQVIERSQGRAGIYPSLEDWATIGVLHLDIDGERFALFVKNVCACSYGENWEYRMMAVCESNASLNTEIGYGTTLISIVPDEWHQKILKHLIEKD